MHQEIDVIYASVINIGLSGVEYPFAAYICQMPAKAVKYYNYRAGCSKAG
jgi:hypothetical protein